jgi:hypothetical protein
MRLPLTRGKFAFIDYEDFDRCIQHSWSAAKTTYNNYRAEARIKGKLVRLHRFIMNPLPSEDVHHKDGNPLNNRKSNLEVCSRSYNLRNNKNKHNSTGIVETKSGKYKARLSVHNKTKWLGTFESKEEAINVRKNYVKKIR